MASAAIFCLLLKKMFMMILVANLKPQSLWISQVKWQSTQSQSQTVQFNKNRLAEIMEPVSS